MILFGLIVVADCGNSIGGSGGPAADGDALCNMPCSGNSEQMCGGPNRLNVYEYTGVVPTPIPDEGGDGGQPGTGDGEGNGEAPAPVTSGLPASWSYQGCWMYVPGQPRFPLIQFLVFLTCIIQ